MKLKHFLSMLMVCMVVACVAQATAKAKKKTHFKLVAAYHKNIAESEQTNPPMNGHFFVIRWEQTTYPETFFWRGDRGWLSCSIERAHKVVRSGKTEYTTESIDMASIHRGDTLMLTPLTGGRFPIPDEIPAKAKNTLFYKTGGSAWLSFPVSKIAKR